jgi:DNA-binding response OmpR family regulator
MNKILLVDDDDSIRLLYDYEFTDEGYSVISTNGDDNLLDMIGNIKPDVIVMDKKLKNLDGTKVIREIRNSYHDIPVILCTTAYESYKNNLESIGTDFLVKKSSDLTELKNTVKLAISPSDESQPKKSHEKNEKIILPSLFREQIELGIKGLRHDLEDAKGGE